MPKGVGYGKKSSKMSKTKRKATVKAKKPMAKKKLKRGK